MAVDINSLRMPFKIGSIIELIKNKYKFIKEHPNYFYPDGLAVFVGEQGSGKTLSAVNYVYNVMQHYPKCMLVTNVQLRDYPIDYERVFPFDNDDDFKKYNNGEFGVIFLVDEIQLYLNSLESKNINLDVVNQISQQRKQRKHIVCTSQVFGRMAKPLREQFSTVIVCKNYFRMFQLNKLVDRDSLDQENSSGTELKGKCKKKVLWIHRYDYYDRYDTYYTISRNKFISEELKKGDIYGLSDSNRNMLRNTPS